jgi:HAD superfamily hydrolase (TIGR01509 family)
MINGVEAGGRFDTVIFDLDGVLVNTSRCHERAYEDLWREIGIEGPPYDAIAGRTTRESIAEVTARLAPSAAQIERWVREKQERAREYMNTESISFTDTRDAIACLTKLGYTLAVGTSASRDSAEVMLRRVGIERAFKTVVTGDDVARGKPAPDIYERAMEATAANPDRTLIVEDSSSGLDSALGAGAFAAGVRGAVRKAHSRYIGAFADLASLVETREAWEGSA